MYHVGQRNLKTGKKCQKNIQGNIFERKSFKKHFLKKCHFFYFGVAGHAGENGICVAGQWPATLKFESGFFASFLRFRACESKNMQIHIVQYINNMLFCLRVHQIIFFACAALIQNEFSGAG